jgi:predicted amidohydrolase YtcJ
MMNPEQPSATWLAVLGGDIFPVGSGDDYPDLAEVIDADGLSVFPGFHDAHAELETAELGNSCREESSHIP